MSNSDFSLSNIRFNAVTQTIQYGNGLNWFDLPAAPVNTNAINFTGDVLEISNGQWAWDFLSTGEFVMGNLPTDPADPSEGAMWYNTTSHSWKGFDGTDVGTFDFTPDA